jgi:LmbE family N-acetylglucosaminyl deacetylase
MILAVLAILGGASCANRPAEVVRKVDLLVIAPHSDDEAIGCTTTIQRALAAHKRVGIVVVTAGDAHVQAAAALAKKPVNQLTPADFAALATLRQEHTLEAMPKLGVDRQDIHFLGYPDGGLTAMWGEMSASAYRQPHTMMEHTYGSPIVDYHTQTQGKPAAYMHRFLTSDLAQIIRTCQPSEIYTTDEADKHPDHAVLPRYVREAAEKAGFTGKLRTFVVHGKPPPQPPTLKLQLTPEELNTKRETITLYQRGVSPVHDKLAEEYAQPEEVFWEK